MPNELKPADIFLTRGDSWISAGIRFFSRGIGEARTRVNHAGLIVEGGPLTVAVAVEARSRVLRHRLWDAYGPPCRDAVAIYRARNLTDDDVKRIVARAEDYVGRKYGVLKIAAHLADWALLGAYAFRRLAAMDKYPICSWVVAHAYAKAGKNFGVAPGAAQPDDIWDFIKSPPDIYEEVWPLQRLE